MYTDFVRQVIEILQRRLFFSGPVEITVGTLLLLLVGFFVWWKLEIWIRHRYMKPILQRAKVKEDWQFWISAISRVLFLLVGAQLLLGASSLDYIAYRVGARLVPLFSTAIIHIGKASLSLESICYLVILWTALVVLTSRMQNWIVSHLFFTSRMNVGIREAIGSILRYAVIGLGSIIILQTVGVDLSSLTVVVGALGLGVSFGLQTITTNFVSGIIVLLERPIKVGDRIDVGSITGDVIKIALRATTVRTNDNIEIIIPNSEFINNKVINWSYSNKTIRFSVPIGTAYDSDPKQVRSLLLEAARAHQGVLETPPPEVIFIGFGDSSLNFELRVWTEIYCTTPLTLKSDLYFAIFDKFKEANIEVPFPQRDIHIRSAVDFIARQTQANDADGSSTNVAGASAAATVSAAPEHARANSEATDFG